MSLLQKVTRALLGDVPILTNDDLVARMRPLYNTAVERSRQLAKHAGMAPNEFSQRVLTRLAGEEAGVADRLRERIRSLGGFAGDVREAIEAQGAANHWGRLGHDLEALRATVRECLDLATTITDHEPILADFLRNLAREEEYRAEQIRDLIARSDPHSQI